jgi:hypothetical protein
MTFKVGDKLVHKTLSKKVEVIGVSTKLYQVSLGRGKRPWMRKEDVDENYKKEGA